MGQDPQVPRSLSTGSVEAPSAQGAQDLSSLSMPKDSWVYRGTHEVALGAPHGQLLNTDCTPYI